MFIDRLTPDMGAGTRGVRFLRDVMEQFGRPGCRVPTCGLDWITTRPPVVLDLWPLRPEQGEAFTSVGSWRGPFAAIEFEGTSFGLRAHEFRKFFELPRITGERFELA